jgi:hypothetical protein
MVYDEEYKCVECYKTQIIETYKRQIRNNRSKKQILAEL